MTAKRYLFSLNRYHDIEYYRNYLFSVMCDLEQSDEHHSERYKKIHHVYYGELSELMEDIASSRIRNVAFLTGKQIGFVKKIISWAAENRARILIENDKYDYLQYC